MGRAAGPGGGKRWNWNFDTYAREDVTDLLQAVRRMHRGPLFMLCHSMGGYAALAGLAMRPEMQASLRGICLLAAAINDYSDGGISKRLIIPFSSLISGMLGRLPAARLIMGTSDEPAALMKQIAHWASTRSFCSYDRSTDYWQALKSVELPVFAGIGAADRFHASPRRAAKLLRHLGSTEKELIVFGRAYGFEVDYKHLDILRGEPAQREVLPCLHDWMQVLIASSS